MRRSSRGLAELDERTRDAIDRASNLHEAIPAFVTARSAVLLRAPRLLPHVCRGDLSPDHQRETAGVGIPGDGRSADAPARAGHRDGRRPSRDPSRRRRRRGAGDLRSHSRARRPRAWSSTATSRSSARSRSSRRSCGRDLKGHKARARRRRAKRERLGGPSQGDEVPKAPADASEARGRHKDA